MAKTYADVAKVPDLTAVRDILLRREAAAREQALVTELTRKIAGELRALADELDPPALTETEKLDRAVDAALAREPVTALAWDAERVLTAAEREQTAKHAAPESVEYTPELVDGRLTLRPTGRSWPAACEMCGAGNGQPCQAVSE